jgi:hypothetical protein
LSLIRTSTILNENIVDYYFGPFGREQERFASTDTPAGTGDNGSFAFQAFASVLGHCNLHSPSADSGANAVV